MSNIYDFPLSYSLVKKYISFTFKRYYGEYIVIGKENIPTNAPVIFAPNHTNALMDALALTTVVQPNMPVVFLARADIFKNKTAAKILKFTKIMPAFRMRDGVENLGRNQEIFDNCVEVLHHNKALGIMPEGNQEIERKLRPLVKGIFRVAFAAQQKYGNQPAVKIIPIGLDFGDIIKFGKHIIISIGQPIEVSEYMEAYGENPVLATNQIREKLRVDLSNLTFDLATEKHYECFETATEVCNTAFLNKSGLSDNTLSRFVARQKIAEKLVELEKDEPEKTLQLEQLCQEYTKKLKQLKLKSWLFEQAPYNRFMSAVSSLILLLTFPIFIFGFIANFLPFFTPVYIRKYIFKTEFIGFFSSLQYGLGLITFPIFYTIQTVIFTNLTNFPWWASLLFLFAQYPLGKHALSWNSHLKKIIAKIRFNRYLKISPDKIQKIKEIRNQIIKLVIS